MYCQSHSSQVYTLYGVAVVNVSFSLVRKFNSITVHLTMVAPHFNHYLYIQSVTEAQSKCKGIIRTLYLICPACFVD